MLPRKIRRALQHERKQKGLPPAKPWTYQQENAERRRQALLLRGVVDLLKKHGGDLDAVQQALKMVTTPE